MAIRVIGSKGSDTSRILKPKKRDDATEGSSGSEGESTTGIEHESDESDNSSESDAHGQSDYVDLDSIDTGSGSNTGSRTYTGKRRGRKPGSTNRNGSGKRSSSGTSKTTDSVAAMLFTVHSVAGAMLKMDAIKIPKSACEELAEAILQVSELYEIPLMDEKSMAWMNLAGVACKIYIFNGKATVTVDADTKRVHVVSDPIPMPVFMKG